LINLLFSSQYSTASTSASGFASSQVESFLHPRPRSPGRDRQNPLLLNLLRLERPRQLKSVLSLGLNPPEHYLLHQRQDLRSRSVFISLISASSSLACLGFPHLGHHSGRHQALYRSARGEVLCLRFIGPQPQEWSPTWKDIRYL